MNKLRKRFKKETGEDYLIEVNKSESNTEFNWQYVKWLEEQIVSKNKSLHDVSCCETCGKELTNIGGSQMYCHNCGTTKIGCN